MKKLMMLCCLYIFQCTHSVYIQPHVHVERPRQIIDEDAGLFISSEDLTNKHEKFNFLVGRNVTIPLGTPLKEIAIETFAPFYRKVIYVGRKDYEVTPHIVEISMFDFDVTSGLDTHLAIKCVVTTKDKIIFSDVFKGSGSGTAATGLLDDKRHAEEQIRKSAEEAFAEAFEKMQVAFSTEMKN